MGETVISNKQLGEKVDQLAEKIDRLTNVVSQIQTDIPALIQTKIDELAETTQRGFTAMQEQNEREHEEMRAENAREHEEMRAENAREHEETRATIADKADLYEVVKHPEFDRLEQRVTQLELK